MSSSVYRQTFFKWGLSILIAGSLMLMAQLFGLWHAFGQALFESNLMRIVEGANALSLCL